MTKVYKSKFGWEVFLFLTVMFSITSYLSYQSDRTILEQLLMLSVPILVIGLFVLISFTTKYTINPTKLHIKCIPFYNKSIALSSINKVEVTRNLISSPAPSLERIEIYFNNYDSVVISPKDKLQFMDDLQKMNSSITLKKNY